MVNRNCCTDVTTTSLALGLEANLQADGVPCFLPQEKNRGETASSHWPLPRNLETLDAKIRTCTWGGRWERRGSYHNHILTAWQFPPNQCQARSRTFDHHLKHTDFIWYVLNSSGKEKIPFAWSGNNINVVLSAWDLYQHTSSAFLSCAFLASLILWPSEG